MKLSSFLIGMLAMASLTAVATLALGGSARLAVAMWFATLVVAQILYAVLLVALARFSGAGHNRGWAEAGAKGVFAHQNDLGERRVKRSSGPKA